MKKISIKIGVFLSVIVGVLVISLLASNQKDANRPVKDYNVYAVDLPEKVNFAGEETPLNFPDVQERFDRELLVNTYWQSNGFLFIKRMNKYFPIIEPILERNGIPNDFKYLALIESGLQNIISSAGATGFWQFMKPAAKEYGLEVSDEVDERYHLEKSTQAACDYLNAMKQEFGSWTLAAAAYNMGKTGVANQIKRQKQSNYYDLHLNNETSRYVFRILAVKEIFANPHRYGFNYHPKQLYKKEAVKRIQISEGVEDWADFAIQHGTNYKTLRIYNPWIRSMKLTNKHKKTYIIELPK